MTPAQIRFLRSDAAKQCLGEIDLTRDRHVAMASRLRVDFSTSEVHALLETVHLREKGATKFSCAADMLFVAEGLEQASGESISRYRAARFAAVGATLIADLCCGLGGDALGLSEIADVIGVDYDYSRLMLARHNMAVYGHGDRFFPLQADLATLPPLAVDGLFFDPARRDERGKRIFSVEGYRPPLSLLDRWRPRVPEVAAKISPGVNYDELPEDAEAEFISVYGEVKECVLWYGRLRTPAQRRATLLPGRQSLTNLDTPPEPIPVTEPQSYLYEPDGAVIRAHLIQALGSKLEASQIDGDIAYLTSDKLHDTPFATPFVVVDWFPFQLKRLRHYLQERDIGRVEIKKRGSPLDVDLLRRQLRLKGNRKQALTLFLTRVQGVPSVLVARRLPPVQNVSKSVVDA